MAKVRICQSFKPTVIRFIFVQNIFHDKNFHVKIFLYDYVNNCSIRVVQSYVKFFAQVFCIRKLVYNERKANYGMLSLLFNTHFKSTSTEYTCNLHASRKPQLNWYGNSTLKQFIKAYRHYVHCVHLLF